MASHSISRSTPWLFALCLAASCKDDGDQDGDAGSSSSDTDSTADDDDSATAPQDDGPDDDGPDDDGPDDEGPSDDDAETTDPDTSGADTTDPDDTGNDDSSDSGTPGDSLYEEPFDGPEGSAWPEPWRIIGTHIIDAEIDGGRGRMSGENNLTARIALDGFDVVDADVTVKIEYEDWTRQGYGFYVRQNGGALQETNPPGQGYGDAVGVVRALRDKGAQPRVVTAEVISDELVSRGVDTAAQITADAACDVLTAAARRRTVRR